jgi:hypothetical protein
MHFAKMICFLGLFYEVNMPQRLKLNISVLYLLHMDSVYTWCSFAAVLMTLISAAYNSIPATSITRGEIAKSFVVGMIHPGIIHGMITAVIWPFGIMCILIALLLKCIKPRL